MLTRILRISSYKGVVGQHSKQRLPIINWLTTTYAVHQRMLSNETTGEYCDKLYAI